MTVNQLVSTQDILMYKSPFYLKELSEQSNTGVVHKISIMFNN